MKINYKFEMKEFFKSKLHQYLILVTIVSVLLPIEKTKAQAPGGVSAGLKFWMRADTGAGVYSNGTAVSQWNDMSGQSNHVTQSTSTSKPTYRNNNSDNINFNPVLNFDGNDNLSLPSYVDVCGDFTFFGVQYCTGNNFRELINNIGTTGGWRIWQNTTTSFGAPFVGGTQVYGGGPQLNTPQLLSLSAPLGASTTAQFYTMGPAYNIWGSGSTSYTKNTDGRLSVGSTWVGNICEQIIYDAVLNATDRHKVNTYLAIKYGLQLSTLPYNFTATDGTIIWNISRNSSFNNRIAGIGRDDAELLNQKQSTVDAANGLNPIVGLGNLATTNKNNTSTFSANKSYLVWGDNDGSTGTGVPVANNKPVGLGAMGRMGRVWKVQTLGTLDSVSIALNATYFSGNDHYLIISSDSTFASGNTWISMSSLTLNGKNYYSAKCLLSNNQFFTFANNPKYPGGVTGVGLWLKANDRVNVLLNDNDKVASWKNEGFSGLNPSNSNSAQMPTYKNNTTDNINYNPVLVFNGSQNLSFSKYARVCDNMSYFDVHNLTGSNYNELIKYTGTSSGFNIWQNNTNYGGIFSVQMYGYGGTINTPQLLGLTAPWGTNVSAQFYNNAILSGSGTVNYNKNTNGLLRIGGTFNGSIGEQILFDSVLTATDRNKVYTYLAIKYGFTLNQSTPLNYLSTNGTIIWNANRNSTFKNNIFGIGRDDIEDLNQRVSKSINLNMVSIGLKQLAESNQLSNATFAADGSYLVCGDNNGSVAYNISVSNNIPGAASGVSRMQRVWKTQITGSVDTIHIAIPKTAIPNNKKYLIVSNDSSFSSGNVWYELDSLVHQNSTYYGKKIVLSSGSFLTFANEATFPGGVGRVAVWLKANDPVISSLANNTAVSSWSNQSTAGNATQNTIAYRPLIKNNSTNNLNFNPVVSFDGTNDCMEIPFNSALNGAITGFSVHAPSSSTGNKTAMSSFNTAGNLGWLFSNNGLGREFQTGTGSTVSTLTGGTAGLNEPEVAAFSAYLGAGQSVNIYKDNEVLSSGTQTYARNTTIKYSVGSKSNSSSYWNGTIAEQILFDTVLTANERQRVGTYLAIKYGLTMSQQTPTHYLATDSKVIWNAATNSSFKYNIAGVGRDDKEGLSQKQSMNASPGRQLFVSKNTISSDNNSNPDNFSADISYLVWGDNNKGLGFSIGISNNVPSGATSVYRMERVWKFQKTGSLDSVTIAFPNTFNNSNSKYLVASNDSSFSAGNVWYTLTTTTLNGVTYYTTRIPINTGRFITFAGNAQHPGGVSGSSLWLKANNIELTPNNATANANHNKGFSSWINYGSGDDATQMASTSQPIYKYSTADNINFNPTVLFGSPTYYNLGVLGLSGQTNANVFSVLANKGGGTGCLLYPKTNTTDAFFYSSTSVGNSSIGLLNTATATGSSSTFGSTYLSGGERTGSNISAFINGKAVGTGSSSNNYASVSGYTLGLNSISNSYIGANNNIPEVIVYPFALSSIQKSLVNSYLAIKYGLSIDQTTPTHYLATDSSIIWNSSRNSAFKYHILGIGRDDKEGLKQVQSTLSDTGRQLLIGRSLSSTNINNGTNFANDKAYVVCGDNNLNDSLVATLSSGKRMRRIWKTQTKNTTETFRIAYPASGFNNITNKYLVVSTDSSFNSQFQYFTLTQLTLNGTNYFYADVALQDGNFFTFAEWTCNTPVLTPSSQRHNVTSNNCNNSGWLYYKHPTDPTSSLVAIHPNGNTWNPDSVIVDNWTTGTYSATDGYNTTALGTRMVTIIAPGTFTTNGGIKLRFYYAPGDWTGLPTTTQQWFKHAGKKPDVLADLTPTGLLNCIILTPSATGTENGVQYVEFNNITSFSTFGFGGTTDIGALPIKLVSFTAQALNENSADINWSFYTDEQKPITFTLQSSSDGSQWNDIAVFENEGKTGILKYNYVDNKPIHPFIYYKLKIHAVDNEPFESNKLFVNWNSEIDNSRLYPNPNSGTLTINLGGIMMNETNSIEILNAQGEVVKTFANLDGNSINLNIEDLSDGLYWIRIINENGNQIWSNKFILNH
jgi:hypothetical protein